MNRYKTSKNIISTKIDNEWYLMSFISKKVIKLSENEYKTLKKEKFDNFNNEDIEELEKLGIIVDNISGKTQEYNSFIKKKIEEIQNDKTFELTIMPSIICNLKCKYCYESNRKYEKNNMDYLDVRKIKKFIELNSKNAQEIRISFTGGEPLINSKVVVDIVNWVKDFGLKMDKQIYISLSSNLSLEVNSEILELINKKQINHIETTIAGNEVVHNKLRNSNNKSGYSVTVKNIADLSKLTKIIINFNVHSENYKTILEDTLNVIKQSKKPENIYIVYNRVVSYDNNPCEEIVISKEKYNESVLNAYNYLLDKGINICDATCFDNNYIYCNGCKENFYTIIPGGYLFKCSSNFSKNNSIGFIDEIGEIKYNGSKNIKDSNNIISCEECEYFYYCCGGCLSSDKKEGCCPIEIGSLNEYFKIYLKKNYLC